MENNFKPYRISIFFHDLGIGGAERVMLQLAQGFTRIGHPVDLVLARAEGSLISEVPAGVRIIDFNTENPHRSEEHTSELQSLTNLLCRLLPSKKKIDLTDLGHDCIRVHMVEC